MAIVSVNETVGSREAAKRWDDNSGEKTNYTRAYLVVCDDTLTDMKELLDLAGNGAYGDTIPEMGDGYPTDGTATVHDYDCQELDGYLTFLVLVMYKQPPTGGQNSDPTQNDWVVSTDFVPYQRIIENEMTTDANGDVNGDPITNSAKDPFIDPLMETYSYVKINASKWFSSWDIEEQAQRQGAINDQDVTAFGEVFPTHTLRCVRWTTSGKQELSSGDYYQLQAEFIYRPIRRVQSDDGPIGPVNGKQFKEVPGWDRAVIDQGFNEIRGGVKRKIATGGQTALTPFKLDGNGLHEASLDTNIFLVFQTCIEQDMTTWGLPTTMP